MLGARPLSVQLDRLYESTTIYYVHGWQGAKLLSLIGGHVVEAHPPHLSTHEKWGVLGCRIVASLPQVHGIVSFLYFVVYTRFSMTM